MPDPITILAAIGVALAVSALALLERLAGTKGGYSHGRFRLGAGQGAGFLLGCCALGKIPHWPPVEDTTGSSSLVLPAVVVVELLAAFPSVPRWLIWPLRMILAARWPRFCCTDRVTSPTRPARDSRVVDRSSGPDPGRPGGVSDRGLGAAGAAVGPGRRGNTGGVPGDRERRRGPGGHDLRLHERRPEGAGPFGAFPVLWSRHWSSDGHARKSAARRRDRRVLLADCDRPVFR